MKTKGATFLILAALFLAACSSKETNTQEQLNALVKERDDLNEKIKTMKTAMLKAGDSSSVANMKTVAITTLTAAPFNHFVDVQARVDANQSINVNPKMSGSVTQILVNEGDHVSKGQVLATLDDQLIRQSMNELKSQLDFVTNIYNKQKALWDQKIGSEVQYLTAKNNKESLENKMATVREQWEMTKIKSPIDGSVDNISLKIGQMAMPGMPCINVVNLSGLKIKAEVAETFIARIKVGDEVNISLPDLNKEITAKVTFVSSVVNNASRTFTVEAKLPGNENTLRPNMIAVMRINDYNNPNTITVPVAVVQSGSEGSYVYVAVIENGKKIVMKKDVVTGINYNGQVEIKSGLAAGDQLITAGFQELNPGEEIKF